MTTIRSPPPPLYIGAVWMDREAKVDFYDRTNGWKNESWWWWRFVRPEAGFLNNHFFGTWNFPTKGGSRKILEIGFFEKVWTYPFVGCNFGRNELWWIFWTVSESHRFINIFLNHSYQLSQNKSMQKLFLWNILIFKQKLLHVLKLVVGIQIFFYHSQHSCLSGLL